MRRQDFHFELPDELIAQRPTVDRVASRLMHVMGDGSHPIASFPSIIEAFSGHEVLVLNDTRVVPARVRGEKFTGGQIEFFFLEDRGHNEVRAMLRGKRLRTGTQIRLPGEVTGELLEQVSGGVFNVRLSGVEHLWTWLEATGEVPLPPYIKRTPDEGDQERYQTVYAHTPGAVAAPTAGLHFTSSLLKALEQKGVSIQRITLHVGLGTFMPMRVDEVTDHQMHSESYSVPDETRRMLDTGRPVVAVGTTVVRALESYAQDPNASSTEIFIYPGFEFQLVDGLLTNFHLPESTLLMLVSAFAGRDRILEAYRHAVQAKMRFFSYGDAMLLRREGGRWT